MALTLYGNAPCFSVYNSGYQTLTGGVESVISYDTKEYDTNSFFNLSTSKFQPTIPGWYELSCGLYFPNNYNPQLLGCQKNGVKYREFGRHVYGACCISGTTLVYMNGSSDYFQVSAYLPSTNTVGTGSAGTSYCWFTGFLARSAS